MQVLNIEGNKELTGSIRISGAKNAAVALIPAAILCDEKVKVLNVPKIADTDVLCEILSHLNVSVERDDESLLVDASTTTNNEIPAHLSEKLRASYYFMGALLSKYKRVKMHFPGGCPIGQRPINLHLKGFEALGAKITNEGNCYIVEAEELIGTKIYLDFASVGATINIMLAAVKAKGVTEIENAAKEPEIVNVATFLNNMGAKIRGAGTSVIRIEGVEKLHKCFHEVIPDRIEAGTYVIVGAACGKDLTIENIIPKHIEALTSKLIEMGADLDIGMDYVTINAKDEYKPVSITTMTYPGFATDLQQPLTPLLTKAKGKSSINETIWENRYLHIPELNKMGADMTVENKKAIIKGPTKLHGAEVEATDLRAGACLVIAGLMAEGKTTIKNINHILRGYEQIVEKLTNVGAKIEIKEI